MAKMSIEPDKFFAKVTNAGSHENAVMAVQQGTCDVAFNWWNSENDSNLSRMVNKGMVKKEDFKIVFRSDRIPGSPFRLPDVSARRPARRDPQGFPRHEDEEP